MRTLAIVMLLASALLSGCVVEETDPEAQSTDPSGDSGLDSQSEPTQEPVAPEPTEEQQEAETIPAAPHGAPQWTNGTITTGSDANQVPSAWARQDVAVSNGFGDLEAGDLTTMVSAGSITVLVEDRADYLVQASLEVRAPTEDQARATLERTRLDHRDSVEDGVLVLSDEAVTDPVPAPVPLPIQPPVIVTGDVQLIVHLTITLPLPPAVSADLGSSSGDILVQNLRGATLDADSSSGDIVAQAIRVGRSTFSASSGDVVVEGLEGEEMEAVTSSGDVHAKDLVLESVAVSTSSGDATLRGAFDDLDASTSSGGIDVEAAPQKSGKFDLDASSGSIELKLPSEGHAYHAEASTSSGDIDVDLPDADVDEEEDHVEATTPGFEDADLATDIEATTSSGDIGIQAK